MSSKKDGISKKVQEIERTTCDPPTEVLEDYGKSEQRIIPLRRTPARACKKNQEDRFGDKRAVDNANAVKAGMPIVQDCCDAPCAEDKRQPKYATDDDIDTLVQKTRNLHLECDHPLTRSQRKALKAFAQNLIEEDPIDDLQPKTDAPMNRFSANEQKTDDLAASTEDHRQKSSTKDEPNSNGSQQGSVITPRWPGTPKSRSKQEDAPLLDDESEFDKEVDKIQKLKTTWEDRPRSPITRNLHQSLRTIIAGEKNGDGNPEVASKESSVQKCLFQTASSEDPEFVAGLKGDLMKQPLMENSGNKQKNPVDLSEHEDLITKPKSNFLRKERKENLDAIN